MNDMLVLVTSMVAGVLLGVMFFGGLWWTVQAVVSSRRPGIWVMGSFLLRTSLTLAGFYFVAQGYWERLLTCSLGFFLARLIVTHFTRKADKPAYAAQEISHEPQPR